MLVLEYMENGDLKQYLEQQRLKYAASVAWKSYVTLSIYLFCFDKRSGQCCLSSFSKTLLKMCRDIASGMEYFARKSFIHRVSAC